jgi:hypothetical protein
MTTADKLTQGLDQLRDSITRTARIAPDLARQEVRREGRAYFRGAVVASVITSLLVGLPLALLANRFAQHAYADQVRAAQFQSEVQNVQRLAQSAHDFGVQANAELTRRGLTPVLIPTPGRAPDSQVLAAASLAQVAASIASQSPAVPTAAQIQTEVALALAKLPPPPVGPTAQQLTQAVQAYIAANTDGLRGARGERGVPGSSPPCLAQPTRCQGAPGLPGAPPVGWTAQEPDGSLTSCERAAAFDPAAPRYQCSRTASPRPAPPLSGTTQPRPTPR